MARLLGLDVGEKRIGIAISDPTGTLAQPLQTLVRGSRAQDFAAIQALVTDHHIGCVVVGRPLRLDGTEGPQALRVARYGEALAHGLAVAVLMWDERYSTAEAEGVLRQNRPARNRRPDAGRARRGQVDAIAAAVILQRYLDSRLDGPRTQGD